MRMAEPMNNAIAIVIVIVIVLALFALWRYFMQRAVRTVVSIFRKNGAVSAKTAKTLNDLGLAPKPFLQRAFRPRDYKPQALRLLDQEGCIRLSEAGKIWLCEEVLRDSRLRHFAHLD